MAKIKHIDHLGQEFSSIRAMCKQWNVNTGVYRTRRNKGWTIKECLTGKQNTNIVYDFDGNPFPSLKAMLKHYEITDSQYRYRIESGKTLKEALIIPTPYKNGTKLGNYTIIKCLEFPYYLVVLNNEELVKIHEQLQKLTT